ncbi:MAG: hypothetical protein PHE61_00420 [Candidatus Omnitrophica bacterium]|nr:hypothetical protein [Candidatus Omnitrophota bacterium]
MRLILNARKVEDVDKAEAEIALEKVAAKLGQSFAGFFGEDAILRAHLTQESDYLYRLTLEAHLPGRTVAVHRSGKSLPKLIIEAEHALVKEMNKDITFIRGESLKHPHKREPSE